MRARRALILLVALALLIGLGPSAWSQKVPRATCLDCHEAEGMKYAVIQSTPFVEVPTGEAQELEITVSNPWLHDLTAALVTVDLTQAPGLSFDTNDPLHLEENVTLTPAPGQGNVTLPFEVLPGATGVVARMEQSPDTSGQGAQDVDTRLTSPEGPTARAPRDGAPESATDLTREPGPARPVEQYAFRAEAVAARGTGTWNLTAFLAQPVTGPNTGGPVDVHLVVDVYYNATRTQSRLISETIGPGGSETTAFTIKGSNAGQAQVRINTTLTSYYAHPSGIGAQDEGNTTLRRGSNFTIGERLELGEAGPAVPPTPPISWKLNARIWGEATGFIGLFMVPISLVLGGAFGRQNVLWVNKITKSARIRVLWHNTLSFFLLGISLLHLLLFLYEEVYDWSVGMVWGGLGTIGLIGLAVTGGFQRWFARRMGYAKWRLLHIAMAVLFVATVLAHVLVDGAHFDIFRDWLGLT
ncbi:MAG: hypothetical protein R3185_06340 [Candidatus Thermoplasmatota archaeon]|nr:hypothetical protein [Candidatus Thermoplasmatota archaeon]